MKKILSLFLAVVLMGSMLTVGSVAAENESPIIVDAIAINDTQYKITTSEPITVKNEACFALFVSKNGTVPNLTEKDGRNGGTISPINTPSTEFVWTINTGRNAATVVSKAIQAGDKVYLGLNGNASTGMIDTGRAVDGEGRGFVPNLSLNHDTHGAYGILVIAFSPSAIHTIHPYNIEILSNENKTVSVNFNQPVSLSDITKVRVDDNAIVSAIPKGDMPSDTYTLTLSSLPENSEKIYFGVDAFQDIYGRNIAESTLYFKPWEDPSLDYGTQNTYIESGKKYNFMNCDTGRDISIDDADEFVLEAIAGKTNMYNIKTENGYLDISGAEIRESSAAVPVLIYPMGNERYQLITSGHMLTIDNDAGEGNDAVISHVKKSEVIPIRYAWYITEENAIRPLKVMPLGDSITYGVNSTLGDGEWKRVGYREMLSEQLTEYFGRVVFVGSQVTTVTTAEETRLLRHEGHPGWVVDQGYLLGLTTNDKRDGLSSIIDGSMEKYAPDIVCLMIGTNDLGVLRNNTSYTETERNGWLAVYEKFVLGIEEKLPNNGLVICSSITPNKDSSWDVYTKSFGEAIMTRVEAMAEDGAKVCVADNYGAVSNAIAELGVDAVFADSVHLKAAGSEAMAWEYLSVIKNNYNSNSIKGNHIAMIGDVKYNSFNDALLAVKVGQTIVLNDDVTVKDTLFVLDAGVVLDLNGHELSVNNVLAFGDIIDSTEGIGKLVRNQNARVILNAENLAMPLYDTNGYRFFTYTLASAGPKNGTTDSVQFGVQLTFANTDAYALLAKDVTTTIKLALAVTKDDKVTNLTFIFKQGTLEQYKDAWNNRTDLTKTPTLVLTVSGIEGVDSISCTPSISQSATTVIRTGSALFYSPIA